jgi:hypothetical protein
MSAAKHFAFRGADAWRKHPVFTWGWKEAMPGIREGTAAFALYCVYDFMAKRKSGASGHGHDGGHGHGGGHSGDEHGDVPHGHGGGSGAAAHGGGGHH